MNPKLPGEGGQQLAQVLLGFLLAAQDGPENYNLLWSLWFTSQGSIYIKCFTTFTTLAKFKETFVNLGQIFLWSKNSNIT